MRALSRNYHVEDRAAEGQLAFAENRFEDAVACFASALRYGLCSDDEEASIRCHLSEALERLGQHREQLEAIVRYDSARARARLSERAQLRVLIRLAWAYSFNDGPRATGLFNQALQTARRAGSDESIGACCLGLGRTYLSFSEFRIARDQYAAALESYRRLGDWRMIAKVYLSLSNIDAHEGHHRDAVRSTRQAIAIIGERPAHDLLSRAYNDLSIYYESIGETHLVADAFDKCLAHVRATNNLLTLSIHYNNRAMRHTRLGEWPQAEQMAKTALDLLPDTPRAECGATLLQTLATIYMLTGRLDEAEALLAEALDKLSGEEGKPHRVRAEIEASIGRCLLARGRTDKVVAHLEDAVQLAASYDDRWYLAEARLWLAEGLLRRGEGVKARACVEAVQSELQRAMNLYLWGLAMRLTAKLDAADGHLARAAQALGQSSSAFELLGYEPDCAANRLIRAELRERMERVAEEKRAGCDTAEMSPAQGLVSLIDGFTSQRLVQAAVSSKLLLHELVSVAREVAEADGALVAEVMADGRLNLVASTGLEQQEQLERLQLLSEIAEGQLAEPFVYRFGNDPQPDYLLQLVGPRSARFRGGQADLRPLLSLVEQGLRLRLLTSEERRPQVFDPARVSARIDCPGFICASRAMLQVLEQVQKIRSSDATVLITGESGTGKELVARAFHAESKRHSGPFLPFNCAAVPHEMLESQLFGYRRGAFTGATANCEGVIRAAEGGTLFLDEIGELPLELQPKLLRFLQEGEIHPLGESRPVRVDVRVVTATNADLEQLMAEGKFREDLFYRLNVIRINVPPLRERREEIPAFVAHYLQLYQLEAGKCGIELTDEAVDLLTVYGWPGNVRQLCNELQRLVAYAESNTLIGADSLSQEIARGTQALKEEVISLANPFSVVVPKHQTLAEATDKLERQMIRAALQRSAGNITQAARALGLSRAGLYLKLNRLDGKN